MSESQPFATEQELEAALIIELLELNQRPVRFGLSGLDAWYLLATLQLACRHPQLTGPVREQVEAIGRNIEGAIATGPAAKEIARRGWDPAYDVPGPPPPPPDFQIGARHVP